MTRVLTDGAEMGDTQLWDYMGYPPDNAATTDPTPIGGTFCYQGAWLGTYKDIAGVNELYIRYRLRTNNVVSDLSGCEKAQILGFREHGIDDLGNDIFCNLCRFTVDEIGRFGALLGDGNSLVDWLELTDIVMKEDVWYLIEIHLVADDIDGIFEVFLDGEQIIDYAGTTIPFIPDNFMGIVNNIYFSTRIYTDVFIDDIAINDTNGGVDNSWCGDGKITKIFPNDDGTDNDWTNTDGDSINNYTYVDEYPNDGDFTYVYCSVISSGTQDQYNMSSLNCLGKTILRIYPEARARVTFLTTSTMKLGILPSGGADDLSADQIIESTVYGRVVGDEYKTNPVDAGAWEEADLDAIEMILET